CVWEALRLSTRSRLDFGFRASTMVVIGDSRAEIEEQKQQVKQQIAFYASTRTYAAVLAAHGLEDLSPRLHAKSLEGDWKGMARLISDAMLEDFAVIGSWSEIGARIRERFAGLYDRTQLYPSFAHSLADPRLPRLARESDGVDATCPRAWACSCPRATRRWSPSSIGWRHRRGPPTSRGWRRGARGGPGGPTS